MNKLSKIFSTALLSVGLLGLPSIASAQDLSVRGEPGVAIPVTDPQADRFKVGGALAVKLDLGVGSYFSLGPSVQLVGLPSNKAGVPDATAWSYGGFVRVKRPHDEKNTGTGWSAVSPWVDSDLKYVRTDNLDRMGWSLAAGASVPTDDTRQLWVGPFVRYDLVNQDDGKSLLNTNSAKTVILGLSFEVGPKFSKPVSHSAVEQKKPVATPPSENGEKKPTPVKEDVVVIFKPRIQFAWDSAKLDSDQAAILADVVKSMLADKSYNVKIDGHASSEGQVEHNNKLAQKRADSVRNFLISNGVDGKRLTTTGFGSRVPVASNKTEVGRVQNRRVEFDVTFTFVKENK